MFETETLYYKDRHMSRCQAELLSLDVDQGSIYMVFDKTIFFPGGGGQAQDRGYILDPAGLKLEVCGFKESDKLIYHKVRLAKDSSDLLFKGNKETIMSDECDYIRSNVSLGTKFDMVLDWDHRLDGMQQHTGQHVLSGVFYKLFSRNTLGLHIGKDVSQLDIVGEFDDEMVKRVERYANYVISRDMLVDNYVLDKEQVAETHTRRPLPNTSGDIRILKIEDLDINACCGVHCNTTSMLRLIKIKKYYRHKGNTRFEYLAGARAISYLLDRDDYFSQILLKYDTNEVNILKALGNLESKKDDFAERNKILLDYYLETKSKKLLDGAIENSKGILVVKEQLEEEDWMVEALAKYMTNRHKVIVILASLSQSSARVFLQIDKKLAKENSIKLASVFKEYASLAGIKGGGSDFMAQGQVLDKKNVDKFIDKIYSIYIGL